MLAYINKSCEVKEGSGREEEGVISEVVYVVVNFRGVSVRLGT